MGKVFISYRREDAAGYARAIYEELTERFTPDRIFMDVDAIEPGLPFDEVIRDAVGQCEVLLVLIGARWLAPQSDGKTRLDDERDFVRLEIAAALARNIRVIPVLLDGAPMPKEADLPEALRGLVWRNAIEVSNSRFPADVGRLTEVLAKVLGDEEKAPPARPPAVTTAASPAPSPSTSTAGTSTPGTVASSPVNASSGTAGTQPANARPEALAHADERPAGKRADARILAAVLAVAVVAALVALWPGRTPSTVTEVSPENALPQLVLALPAYGVVFGSDRTIEAARDEIQRASQSGIKDAALYFRNGFFASVAHAESRAEADRILGIVRAFGNDPYATRMETWCMQPQARAGYVECAAATAKQ
jgi:hypothetical protein